MHAIGRSLLVGSVFVLLPQFSQFTSLAGVHAPMVVNAADIPPIHAWPALVAILGTFLLVCGLALISRYGPLGRWSEGARPFLFGALVVTGIEAGYLARPELRRFFTAEYGQRVKAERDRRPKVWMSGFFWPVALMPAVVFLGAVASAGR